MARPPAGRGPSPRDEARRRDAWREQPEDAPWLDEADYEDEGPTHTLVGRRTLFGLLFGLGVLVVGVIVGIMLVSKRDSAPIDVPAVGEDIPVLASPGPWKMPPSGPDVDGIPVEGQGQVIFGTSEGRETEAQIALDALPEDPLPRPGLEPDAEAVIAEAAPAAPMPTAPTAAPAPAPRPTPKLATPKVIEAPEPASGGSGQTLQLGAFSSEGRARAAFKSLSERYGYLEGFEAMIVPVVSDGKTLYRLRTTAGSPGQARDVCGRLKVAGEACSVVN
jgi:cell division septation protein DedD